MTWEHNFHQDAYRRGPSCDSCQVCCQEAITPTSSGVMTVLLHVSALSWNWHYRGSPKQLWNFVSLCGLQFGYWQILWNSFNCWSNLAMYLDNILLFSSWSDVRFCQICEANMSKIWAYNSTRKSENFLLASVSFLFILRREAKKLHCDRNPVEVINYLISFAFSLLVHVSKKTVLIFPVPKSLHLKGRHHGDH